VILQGNSGVVILAFDCSSPAGSVAVLEGTQLLTNLALDPAKRAAVTLAPAIEAALKQAERAAGAVDLIATTVGPGSFTGLRVGLTMAKTFAYALKCEVIGLNTLDVLANQAAGGGLVREGGLLHAVLDAQRKEFFAARYQACAAQPPKRLDEGDTILPMQTWLESLRAGDVVTGSGLVRCRETLPPGVIVAPEFLHQPDAVTIGCMAHREYEAGRRDNLWTIAPLYIRSSYADEKKPATN